MYLYTNIIMTQVMIFTIVSCNIIIFIVYNNINAFFFLQTTTERTTSMQPQLGFLCYFIQFSYEKS